MISVITPVWNQGDLTRQFLYQNWQRYSGADAEWVIVDNGSNGNTAGVLAMFRRLMGDKLTVIRNDTNRGFPVACNQGVEVAAGDPLIFLNNDVIIYGDYLTPMWQAGRDGALFGAELLAHDTGWNKFGPVTVPYLAGWCVAMSRAAYGDLGGFDERYSPCDYEDMDLSYTAARKGYELASLALPLRHISGVSGRQMPERRQITEQNRVKFAEKWGLACE